MNEEFTHPYFCPDRVLHSQIFLGNFSIQQKIYAPPNRNQHPGSCMVSAEVARPSQQAGRVTHITHKQLSFNRRDNNIA